MSQELTCGPLGPEHIGSIVSLSGRCHHIRNRGGMLFIELRDDCGVTKMVVDPDSPAFTTAARLHPEWKIKVEGQVRATNREGDLHAGELFVTSMEIII